MSEARFWYRPQPRLICNLIGWVGWPYQIATALRLCRKSRWQAPVPVICVGNLCVGGSGKTPVTRALQTVLAAHQPHVVSRGYGGRLTGPVRVDRKFHDAAAVGDEPWMLAAQGPVWVAKDRVAGARAASEAGAGLLILDDGLQNPYLHKDVSLLVVDGAVGFGNRLGLPVGPLRERIATGLARSSALVMIGNDHHGVASEITDKPILRARLEPDPAMVEQLAGQRVWGFAGIARPGRFRDSLIKLGVDLAGFSCFSDHYPFSMRDLTELAETADQADARLVTTEKDAARLPPDWRHSVIVLTQTLIWRDDTILPCLLELIADA